MGFEGMAALTHQMEDVFELLRQRSGGLARETVDVLLECLDALEGATDAIEADGAERLEPARAHRAPARASSATARPTSTSRATAARRAAPVPAAVVEAVGTGHAMLHARVTLADDTLMPAVRAYMVIAAAADLGTVVASAPEEEHVEAFDGRRVDVWVAAGVEAAALSAALTAVPDVATAEVAEVAEAGVVGRGRAVAPVADARRGRRARRGRSRRRHRPRRRRAPGPAHAPHGRARRPAHPGRGPRRPGRGARASRRPCRTSRAARTPCRRSSCRSG